MFDSAQVTQANLLLEQFRQSSDTRYILVPNQHVGSWRTGFMPQWAEQIVPSRCPLLGCSLQSIRIEGLTTPKFFLQVNAQPEVGIAAFDEGARIRTEVLPHPASEVSAA